MSDEWDAKAREIQAALVEIISLVQDVYDVDIQKSAPALTAILNEADTAAERRGIERAAKWHDANAAACTKLVDEGIEVEANEDAYWFHKNAADHLRALAPPMADAGPMEPAGASDREGM